MSLDFASQTREFVIKICIKYSHHLVLRPPSVRGVEVAKSSAAAKARVKSSKKILSPLLYTK